MTRFAGVEDALRWLDYGHLPAELQPFAQPFFEAGAKLVNAIPLDSPELTTALNLLVQAKDSAVRAGIKFRTGRAGPVPRPDTLIPPPPGETHRD